MIVGKFIVFITVVEFHNNYFLFRLQNSSEKPEFQHRHCVFSTEGSGGM